MIIIEREVTLEPRVRSEGAEFPLQTDSGATRAVGDFDSWTSQKTPPLGLTQQEL